MKTNYLTPINSLFLITSIVAIILGNNLFLFFMIVLNYIIIFYYLNFDKNNDNVLYTSIVVLNETISLVILGIIYPITLFIGATIIYLISIKKYFTD